MFLLIFSPLPALLLPVLYFNTSHVSINRQTATRKQRSTTYFNTSHVSINQIINFWHERAERHFNTSHVSINRNRQPGFKRRRNISIHLMFLLIISSVAVFMTDYYFNTSHVSINPLCGITAKDAKSNFNTSHVSINRCLQPGNLYHLFISIHLMFLLI